MDEPRLPLGKVCSKCREWKLYCEFSKSRSEASGHQAYCKPCKKTTLQEWRKNNPERVAAYAKVTKQWIANNPERIKRNRKTWNERHPGLALERDRLRQEANWAYYLEHGEPKKPVQSKPCSSCKTTRAASEFTLKRGAIDGLDSECKECQREKRKDSASRHLHRMLANNRKRRAREAGARGQFTHEEWLALVEFYEETCLCCGERGNVNRDHVVPIVKGGENTIANIQPLCKPCNSSKRVSETDYRDPVLHAEFMAALESEGLL